ncbi:MAG: ABC transporter ATP-binding protein [Erysipelotrichaceae bacterium]|nr:ABC transporter ATP-binding protein [Erysipelotrichaceae bacterium]MDD3924241.1 ABC transporter ATP-binding protein [Erysipelotrichaceae bacterium]MDD4642390.1 ABC transporter ATP-binding protein [Erysipelotrichaceae bacterium]
MSTANLNHEEEFNTDSFDISLWKKIFKLLWEHKRLLIILFTINIGVAVVDVAFPYLNKYAIDHFVMGSGKEDSVVLFIVLFVGFVVWQGINIFAFFHVAGSIEMNFAYEIRMKIMRKLQELSYAYYDKTPNGRIMARMTSDVNHIAEIMSWSLMDLFWGSTVMIGVTIVMLIVNWKLALIVLVIVPILAYISSWFQIRILKNYREVRKVNSLITGSFSEGISGAKTTKTLVLEQNNYQEFINLTGSMRHRSIKAALLNAIFMPLVLGLGAVSLAGILWYGGHQVLIKSLEFGTLMMFTQYSSQFLEPLRQIARLMAELQLAQASAERVISLLEEEPKVYDSDEVIAKYGTILDPKPAIYEKINGNIEFKHVYFHYNPQEPILTDFNLKVKAGQTIALVGETGSGKSTIVNMLCRFYEPIKGKILIDGIDYRQRSIGWLHENLGYVLQSPHLFAGTIKDNIRYGKLDATDEEIIAAAKYVNAHEFIMKMENGYDSDVGEGGGRLSTGEKQLISFARAVIRQPAIFILDEATSSIDTETEQIIQHAIETLLKGKTSFVIAHRLSTIVSADRILVIRKGKVIEDGDHDALMQRKGYYYRLYTNQFNEELSDRLLKIDK